MNFVENEILIMWILWKMRFWKCEFCEKWDFDNVNFVKSEILKMWIWWKVTFSKCEFLDELRIFVPVCIASEQPYAFIIMKFKSCLVFIVCVVCSCNSKECNEQKITFTDSELAKIHWDINGLHQDDPYLIEVIKNRILIPPDSLPLSMLGGPSMKRLMGQYQQVPVVEKLLKLKKRKRDTLGQKPTLYPLISLDFDLSRIL